jgi:hypothetical protein
MVFWGARKRPIKYLKKILEFGNHRHCEQLGTIRFALCVI